MMAPAHSCSSQIDCSNGAPFDKLRARDCRRARGSGQSTPDLFQKLLRVKCVDLFSDVPVANINTVQGFYNTSDTDRDTDRLGRDMGR